MSVLEISRVDRVVRTYDLATLFPDLEGPITAASVALLAKDREPTATTTWTPVTVASGVATVKWAGPDADSTGAVAVAGTGDPWMLASDADETRAVKLGRITVQGGGAPLPLGTAATAYQIAVANGYVGTQAEWVASLKGDQGDPGIADDASVAALIPGPGLTADALAATVAQQVSDRPAMPVAWDLPTPFFLAHRGGGQLMGPDGTLEAMRAAAAQGVQVLDLDFRSTSDGGVIAMHDTTLDRTTSLTGNVSDYSLTALTRANVVDASSWFGGGWQDTKIPTSAQVFGEFGGRKVMFIEPEDANAGAAIADAVRTYGIGPSIVVGAFSQAWVTAAMAAGADGLVGYSTAAATNAADPAALLAQGIRWVSVDHTFIEAGTVLLSKLDSIAAAGVKVVVFGLTRQNQVAMYDGHNIAGFTVDSPVYASRAYSKYRKTTAPWTKDGTFYHGHIPANGLPGAGRGQFIGSPGAYRWQPLTDGFVLQGWACPLVNAASSYTITVPLVFDAVGSDLSRHLDIFMCQATDRPFNATGAAESWANGYLFQMQPAKWLDSFKVTAGVGTKIGATGLSTAAIADGGTANLTFAVSPTQIVVTRTDTGHTVTIADSSYRGGYFYLGQTGYSVGLRGSFGNITIT